MKNHFIRSTFILFIGGFVTKILGMIIKIFLSRNMGIDGLSLYMMILPCFSLFMTIGQIGIPATLSRFVVLQNYSNKKLFISLFPFYLLFNIFLSILIILSSSFLSHFIFHSYDYQYGFIAIGIVIPFTSFSSFFRSYFIGIEKMGICVISNIFENIIRLLFTLFILPFLSSYSLPILLFFVILSNVFSEGISIIILLICFPKKKDFSLSFFSKKYLMDLLHYSTPNILSDLIGNITYFLEPVILVHILLFLGYSNSYIRSQYGVITGYVLNLFFLPSFFVYAYSQAIYPTLTRKYHNHDFLFLKRVFLFTCCFFLIFGVLFTTFLSIFGKNLLFFLYHTELGYSYLCFLRFGFVFYYLETPLIFFLRSFGREHDLFFLSLLSSIIRVISLTVFCFLGFGIHSLLLSITIHIIFTTILLFYKVISYFT